MTTSHLDSGLLRKTLSSATDLLLSKRTSEGYWRGRLSDSALSTATAAFALSGRRNGAEGDKISVLIERALDWLCDNQNPDGGWGDTVKSFSNLSTTLLAWAALGVSKDQRHANSRDKASRYIHSQVGSLEPAAIAKTLSARYGHDRTFSAPILSMLALAGQLGDDPWQYVAQLPFELAALPHGLFRFLRLQVVSYALPALIAIGIRRFRARPTRGILAPIRRRMQNSTLRLLDSIQPPSGGYLEASPLTSFVLMNIAAIADNASAAAVRSKAERFLVSTARPGGCWSIDTELATWVTTLSVDALSAGDDFDERLGPGAQAAISEWLLSQQHRIEHPYTHAAPGGWAWTDLPGGVPDADDTAGALVALHRLGRQAKTGATQAAVEAGVKWLLDLQNSDGGIPTFCRGWGRLPFDRSSADLTANALRAWRLWRDVLPLPLRRRVDKAISRATQYLAKSQRPDGAFLPLWFGNQHAPDDANPVYGTSRVLMALDPESFPARLAAQYLLSAQNKDGGWGGSALVPSSIEETALAIDALSRAHESAEQVKAAISSGANHLIEVTAGGTKFEPSPIGLYFAKLWYFEDLYPIIFTVSALNHVLAGTSYNSRGA